MYCVVGKCNVVKHLNVHVDYIPSHGDYPAWFRHLVINLNVKIFCDNTACRDSCLKSKVKSCLEETSTHG